MDEQRYRAAERRLWESAGVAPDEHRIRLSRNDVAVRIQEVGHGPPVLFLHGGPGAAGAGWAHLAARLPEFRCLLLDRPGTGLSDPHPLAGPAAVREEAETLVVDVLDALELDRAHLVGSSHGSYVALLSAAAHPDRVGRTVHLGCPGFVEGMAVTASDRLVLLPGVPRAFGWFPVNERTMRTTMRQLGHQASVQAGRVGDDFIGWSIALQRDTDTMRNELRTMGGMGSFRRGFDPALTVRTDLLERIASPSYFLWGDRDPYGDESVGRGVVAPMPDAGFELMAGAGHLCWLDDVDLAADVVRRHLAAATAVA